MLLSFSVFTHISFLNTSRFLGRCDASSELDILVFRTKFPHLLGGATLASDVFIGPKTEPRCRGITKASDAYIDDTNTNARRHDDDNSIVTDNQSNQLLSLSLPRGTLDGGILEIGYYDTWILVFRMGIEVYSSR